MSSTVAIILINPIIEKHLKLYVRFYKDVCPGVVQVYDYFNKQVKFDFQSQTEFNPNDKRLKHATYFTNYLHHDFKDKERRMLLKYEKDALFLDDKYYKETQFIKRLELKRLWTHTLPSGEPYLSPADRENIWTMLKQLWFISQMLLLLPLDILNGMEKIAMANKDIMNQPPEKYASNVKAISEDCKKIIHRLNRKSYDRIMYWFYKLVYGKNTPLLELLPAKYTGMASALHNVVKDDDYKQALLKNILPIMENVKSKAKDRGLSLGDDDDNDDGVNAQSNPKRKSKSTKSKNDVVVDVGKLSFEDVNSDEETYEFDEAKEDKTAEKSVRDEEEYKSVDYVIELIVQLMEKNQRSFKAIYEDPTEIFKAVTSVSSVSKLAENINRDIQDIK